MKTAATITVALAATVHAGIPGFDISQSQATVNFTNAKASGAGFVIIKATEAISNSDSLFSSHLKAATSAGLIRGAYHSADLGASSGASQAFYFWQRGGAWSSDGWTLPGLLQLGPGKSSQCWDMPSEAIVAWIKDFSSTYEALTKRHPTLLTSASWWKECAGNSDEFVQTNPLALQSYASSPGTLPGGWGSWTFWQNWTMSAWSGDADTFNGSLDGLRKFARNDLAVQKNVAAVRPNRWTEGLKRSSTRSYWRFL